MGVGIVSENYATLYEANRSWAKVINDMPVIDKDDRDKIALLTMSKHNTDVYSSPPSCECGTLQNRYRLGSICELCSTPVTDILGGGVRHLVWIRKPHGVSRLISPVALYSLDRVLKYKKDFSYVRWLIDPGYTQGRQHTELGLHLLEDKGVRRGYNHFIDNFEATLLAVKEHIFTVRGVSAKLARNPNLVLTGIEEQIDTTVKLMIEQKDTILTDYLPLPNRTMMLVENTPTGMYMDPVIPVLVDAIKTIQGIDAPSALVLNNRQKQVRTAKTLLMLANYHSAYIKEVLGKKAGAFRRMIFGLRAHFSQRCVITAYTQPHQFDELHIPWSASLVTFELHIANKLYAMGYKQNDVLRKLNEAQYHFDPEINQIFDEITAEFGGKIACYWNRNPSLCRGSYLRMYATIKREVHDYTIGHPPTTIASLNADAAIE